MDAIRHKAAACCRGLLLLGLLMAGCSRTHYHRQADKEVHQLVAEKSCDPRWGLPGLSVEINPRSRYYEPYDEDKPPIPPDDPASHRFMHCVDGKKGYRHWHRNGNRPGLENPCWRELLPNDVEIDEEGRIKLTLESALRLALTHSPDYQEQLEDIYLSALDVSTERFRFDVQFLQAFSGSDTAFTHQGAQRPGRMGGMPDSNTLGHNTDFQLQRRFATAGELLVGFANSTVWQFAGPDTHMTSSILNFSLVQPLLRAGGRAVALEQLTIVERTLLANLRAFQRYRRGFYTNVAIGQLGVEGPQRRGGFLGGTGLTGFTGQGAGGLGGVGGATGFGRGGGGGGAGGAGTAGQAGGGAGQVGGFIGLLQAQQEIRNTQESLNSQLQMLDLLEAHLEAGVIGAEQVDQFRQNIETERANLLQARVDLQGGLDQFKTGTLGLPPDLRLELNDSLVRQFQLIDPRLLKTQNEISTYQAGVGELPDDPPLAALRQAVANAEKLLAAVEGQLKLVQEDLTKLNEQAKSREESLEPLERRSFRRDREELAKGLKSAAGRLATVRTELRNIRGGLAAGKKQRQETYNNLVTWTGGLLVVLNEVSLVQARSRLETVSVEQVDLRPEEALEIARCHRLDWMNNRADLVDTWRLIEFNANALQSNLDITFSGDLQTSGNKPFRFRAPTGQLQAGLQFDGPFNRLLERNNYRQALIDYQRNRRQLIRFEDGVYQGLRGLLRRLEQLRVNLEIQRRAAAIAIRRVDFMREALIEPPPPLLPGQQPQFSPTAAQNLLNALSDLRNTQNIFMSVWLNHHATRMVLYRDLGLMELDCQGLWIDKPLNLCKCEAGEAPPLPPEVPQQWLYEAGFGPPGDQFGPPPLPNAPDLPENIPMEVMAPGQAVDVGRVAERPRQKAKPAQPAARIASPTYHGGPAILRPPLR